MQSQHHRAVPRAPSVPVHDNQEVEPPHLLVLHEEPFIGSGGSFDGRCIPGALCTLLTDTLEVFRETWPLDGLPVHGYHGVTLVSPALYRLASFT